MKEDSIKRIVKKAISKIDKEHVEPGKKIPQRVKFCFFDSKTIFIPKDGPKPGDGPYRTRIDLTHFIKETNKRIRKGRKEFSGVVVYDPRQVSHRSSTCMCPFLKTTFDDFKRKDKKFHCIMATKKNSYSEYKK